MILFTLSKFNMLKTSQQNMPKYAYLLKIRVICLIYDDI